MLEELPLIVETDKVGKREYGLLALPDTGLVGTIAVGHMISSKKMSEIGHVRSSALPPMLVIHNGEPRSPVRLCGNENLVTLISETPLPLATCKELFAQTVGWAAQKGIEL
jgi:predicted ATP-grasp superfamily ATP-dependent carboligase